ncbi:hypothetical protein MHYP_G00291190 [Metynnis hypsauchen]
MEEDSTGQNRPSYLITDSSTGRCIQEVNKHFILLFWNGKSPLNIKEEVQLRVDIKHKNNLKDFMYQNHILKEL